MQHCYDFFAGFCWKSVGNALRSDKRQDNYYRSVHLKKSLSTCCWLFRKAFLKRLVPLERFLSSLDIVIHLRHWAVISAQFSVEFAGMPRLAKCASDRRKPVHAKPFYKFAAAYLLVPAGPHWWNLSISGHGRASTRPPRPQLTLQRANTHEIRTGLSCPKCENTKLVAAFRNFGCACESLECVCCENTSCCTNF